MPFPRVVTDEQWQAFFDCLLAGATRKGAAEEAHISWNTICKLFAEPSSSHGYPFYKQYLQRSVGDAKPHNKLTTNAKRAKRDFEFFRRRYFGHLSTPWQVEAGKRAIELLDAPGVEKKFLVINCPPGSGKSTLFTCDLPLWALTRNRSLRILIGTYAETTGANYVQRIKTHLERSLPVEADEMDRELGLAVNATACLSHDFGRFKPEGTGYWRADRLVVAREGGQPAHQKESSVDTYGRKSSFLGMRYNLVIWDDVVTDANSRTATQQEEMARWWRTTAESRLEPGGLLILQGQRMSAHDLYRYALDLADVSAYEGDFRAEDFDPDKLPRKYHHFVYPAHDETRCKGAGVTASHHQPEAPAWPKGCLLDPKRLPYRDLRTVEHNDPKTYAVVYQQEDTDPGSVLVNPLWINGGQDPVTGEVFPGCWDRDRQVGQWPQGLSGQVYSVVTADPSAANFWGVQWWAYQVDTQFQHLVDVVRKRMDAPDLLDWNHASRCFTGLLEDWWQHSNDIGRPIRHVVVETNAAQRFLLQYDHAKRWSATRGVQLVSHQCVDPATQVLSRRGWLSSHEVLAGDEILTLNTVSGLAEWKPVNSVYRGRHDGPMHRFASQTLDALCTLDHKWPRTDQAYRPLELVESQRLNTNSVLPLARPLAAEQEPTAVYSDDLVELVGWAVTEGHFRKNARSPGDTAIVIGQSERVNAENCERIRSLLKRLDARFTERPNGSGRGVICFCVTGPVAAAVRGITDHGKHLPADFLLTLPAAQRDLLLDVLAWADGWTHGTTTSFCSDTESLIFAYELLSALQGRPTYRATRADRPQHKVVRTKQARHAYLQNPGNRPQVVDYSGEVWCPSTDNGTFYARRGGKTYFTGNTQGNKADPKLGVGALAPHYKFGRVRLPGHNLTRPHVLPLYREVTRYPDTPTTDMVMAHWFLTFVAPRLFVGSPESAPQFSRPSWVANRRRGFHVA